MQFDDKICYCFHISKRKIVNYLRIHRLRRASQLSECGGAGTGCGWCVSYLKNSFQTAGDDVLSGLDSLAPEDYARQRAAYIADGKGTPAAGAVPLPKENDSR